MGIRKRMLSVGDIVLIVGLKSKGFQQLNGNYGKIIEDFGKSLSVHPFTKFESINGVTREVAVDIDPAKINRGNLVYQSRENLSSVHMKLYIEYLTSSLYVEFLPSAPVESVPKFEELYGMLGKNMPPILLLQFALKTRELHEFEKALKLFCELYGSREFHDDPRADRDVIFRVEHNIMSCLVILNRPHAALGIVERWIPETEEEDKKLFGALGIIAQQLSMDICGEKVLICLQSLRE